MRATLVAGDVSGGRCWAAVRATLVAGDVSAGDVSGGRC